jgi:molecular chaperone GrpE
MIEENRPVEETSAPTEGEKAEGENTEGENIASVPDAVPAPGESGGEPAAAILEELDIPELLDTDTAVANDQPIGVGDPVAATATTADDRGDDTDYEAAFLELRSTYAAKEREYEALKAQVDDRQSQYLRLAADFENYRRRTQKEKEDLEIQIKCSTLSELLSVVDNFERARSHLKPANDGEMNIHKSYQSVYKDLVDRFKKIGVSPMRAEGQPFDPNLHNAVMREPSREHPEGTVIEELMRGYVLGDKVLRHAMVKVAAPPEDEPAPDAPEA